VAGQDTDPTELAFSPDGTKMFIVGHTNNGAISQYTLTTGFDVSTASYDSVSFSVAGQDAFPNGLAFNTDGTKMFVLGTIVHQYTLTTGFDVSTASYDNVNFNVSAQDAAFPQGITFNSQRCLAGEKRLPAGAEVSRGASRRGSRRAGPPLVRD
jgi:sugar lactone lactonase YvrE